MAGGAAATLQFTVGGEDTAAALGSGDLDVLGTPQLVAWAEAATCAAIADEIGDHQTSVGTRVAIDHRAASAVGERVRVEATVVHRDGRLLRFRVEAVDEADRLVGAGEVTRVVVDRDRFLARVARPG